MLSLLKEKTTNPVDAWGIYRAMSMHFNSSRKFDAIKYHFSPGKVSRTGFDKLGGARYLYSDLAKECVTNNKTILYCLANIISGKGYITNFTRGEYLLWVARLQNLHYTFKNEMKAMKEVCDKQNLSFDMAVMPSNLKTAPFLYKCGLSQESLMILNLLTNYTQDHMTKLVDPLGVTTEKAFKTSQYTKFFKDAVDVEKYVKTIKEIYNEG